MEHEIVVNISDMKIASGDDVLVTYALGSCIGTCIYDRSTGIIGLSHIMLPESSLCYGDTNIFKFADTALPRLVSDMVFRGANVNTMVAKIAGGAQMFESSVIKIGERNIKAVIETLDRLKIRIVAQDVGSNYGRTMKCYAKDGSVLIKSISRGSKYL